MSTLFEIFGVPIRSYGVMLVVGFALGLWRAVRISQRYKVSREQVYDLALVALLSGVVGARVVFILLNPETESFREFFAVWNGGLSFHGGVLFALLGAYVYARLSRLSFWQCADMLAPSVAIGYAFTRIGCFLNGCCHGGPTDLPWAVRFNENGMLTPPSHPTQIYATITNLLIFLVLARLQKLNRAPGFVFAVYLGLYSVYRFAIEFLRKGYSAQVWFGGLTQAQVVSLAIIVVAGAAAVVLHRAGRPKPR